MANGKATDAKGEVLGVRRPEAAVEQALSEFGIKDKGVNQVLDDMERNVETLMSQIRSLRAKANEFNRLLTEAHTRFYGDV